MVHVEVYFEFETLEAKKYEKIMEFSLMNQPTEDMKKELENIES